MKLVKMKCENCGATLDVNKDLDKIHCNFCGAEILIDDEATSVKRVEEAKLNARKKNHEQSLKERQDNLEQDINEKKILAEANAVDNFKKSKFSKVLLVFAAICGLLTFTRSFSFASIISFVQAGLILTAWLMGMQIIKEPKKKLYLLLAVAGFTLIIPWIAIGNNSSSYHEKSGKIDLNDIELKEYLPVPKKMYGRLETNRTDLLIMDITSISEKDYRDYVKNEVTEKGYTLDLEYEEWDSVYGAFNKEGYSIRISYLSYDKYMSITLEKPEKLEEAEWPTSGLGSKVPTPKSNLINISWNNSETFIAKVRASFDDYNDYVKSVEEKGYIVDYNKDKKSYRAKNDQKYEIHLMYLGGNVMEISLKSPDGKKESNSSTSNSNNTSNNNGNNNSKKEEATKPSNNGLRTDFKKAMDDYETFMNEYVEFMKKYSKSDGSDMSLLKDYATMMSKYEKSMKSFEAWEDDDLNDAETKYYIEVQGRVNKKLLEIQ